jgi:hypothetical protein
VDLAYQQYDCDSAPNTVLQGTGEILVYIDSTVGFVNGSGTITIYPCNIETYEDDIDDDITSANGIELVAVSALAYDTWFYGDLGLDNLQVNLVRYTSGTNKYVFCTFHTNHLHNYSMSWIGTVVGNVFDFYGFSGEVTLTLDESQDLWPSPEITLPLTYDDPSGLISISIQYNYKLGNCSEAWEATGTVTMYPSFTLPLNNNYTGIVHHPLVLSS